ncbi:MBL fold metallo-hydrolase [Geobacter metallireducens]|uniref:MBL fold metallo-hydrolase n=1 Tax=Geobacter metallireducens TaxID=28232 RepID=UPI00164FCB2A|nr:MBL fold metallo-hydrolase [Geobacter metallireducens]
MSGKVLKEPASGFMFMDTLDRGVKGYAGGWLVRGKRYNCIVETGAGAAVPLWLAGLKQAGIPLESIRWILLTHVHLDHAGGAGELLRHLPNARIGIHPLGVRHILDPQRLLSHAKVVWEKDFDLLGPMLPAPAERVVELGDGEIIEIDDVRRIKVLYTPGHTSHHVAFFEESTRGVFSGDALGAFFRGKHPFGEYVSMPGVSPPKGDIPAYVQSVERIAKLSPRRIYATHFGLWEPAMPYILSATSQIITISDLCRDVFYGGGGLQDFLSRAATLLASVRQSTRGQVELEKNYFSMAKAVWNYVVAEKGGESSPG